MKIANYRRHMPIAALQHIQHKFEKLVRAHGRKFQDKYGSGILTDDKRRKLMGLKESKETKRKAKLEGTENGETKEPEDTADFWQDVRNSMSNGLADIQLIALTAHDDQLKSMFAKTEHAELVEEAHKTDFVIILEKLLRAHDSEEVRTSKSDILWKAELAEGIVNTCYNFFDSHGMVSSQAHARTIAEAKNLISAEITIYRKRGAGKITNKSGQDIGEMIFVPQREVVAKRMEKERDTFEGLSTIEKAANQREELEKQAQNDLEQDRRTKEEKD